MNMRISGLSLRRPKNTGDALAQALACEAGGISWAGEGRNLLIPSREAASET